MVGVGVVVAVVVGVGVVVAVGVAVVVGVVMTAPQEKRVPAFWIVQVGDKYIGYDGSPHHPRCNAKMWTIKPYAEQDAKRCGGNVISVYTTRRKVKRPRKLTEAQRNAVADWVNEASGTKHMGDMIRSGKAGL